MELSAHGFAHAAFQTVTYNSFTQSARRSKAEVRRQVVSVGLNAGRKRRNNGWSYECPIGMRYETPLAVKGGLVLEVTAKQNRLRRRL